MNIFMVFIYDVKTPEITYRKMSCVEDCGTWHPSYDTSRKGES